jgi:hypothetical protein
MEVEFQYNLQWNMIDHNRNLTKILGGLESIRSYLTAPIPQSLIRKISYYRIQAFEYLLLTHTCSL